MFSAPRTLNEPVRWKSSHLRRAPSVRLESSGVRGRRSPIVARARSTSSRVGSTSRTVVGRPCECSARQPTIRRVTDEEPEDVDSRCSSVLALAVGATVASARTHDGSQPSAQDGPRLDGRDAHGDRNVALVGRRVVEGACSCASRSNELLGEHAILAIQATQRGLVGGADFPAAREAARRELGRDLEGDRVGLRRAAAGKQFLNGKNLWRAHINDFVAYTVATAKHDKAGQKKAVATLMAYIQTQAAFFAKATGLPKQALVNDLTAHVLQLKGQLDAYAAGQLRAGVHAHERRVRAHVHDRRPARRRRSPSRRASARRRARPRISRSRSTGCSASTRCSPRGRRRPASSGGKNFPALAKQLDDELRRDLEGDRIALRRGRRASTFLNGKNLWRAHINDFVAYTVATAKHDKAGQTKAVADLMAYIQTQAAFFAKAIGLPKQALVNDLTAHVLQLKGALDEYNAEAVRARRSRSCDGAYQHMFMTGSVARRRDRGSRRACSKVRRRARAGGRPRRAARRRRCSRSASPPSLRSSGSRPRRRRARARRRPGPSSSAPMRKAVGSV